MIQEVDSPFNKLTFKFFIVSYRHEELINAVGVYASMWQQQLKNDENGDLSRFNSDGVNDEDTGGKK